MAADIRKVFNAPDRPTADAYLKQIVQKYEQSASRLADWMETHLPEGLTAFAFPVSVGGAISLPELCLSKVPLF